MGQSQSRKNEAGPHRPLSSSGVWAGELFRIGELNGRLGWGARTIAKAQQDGLRVLRYGRWKYVNGADVIDFLTRQADPMEGKVDHLRLHAVDA